MQLARAFAIAALSALPVLPALIAQGHAADRALVIGVGTYAHLPQERWLKGPKNDVTLISSLLTKSLDYPADSIRTLEDEKATKAGIVAAVEEWVIAGTSPGDRVFIYFSGHGVQVPDAAGDEPDNLDEALAPYDVSADPKQFINVIADDELDALVARMPGRFVTLVVDACHSGTVTRAVSGESREPEGARFLSHASLANVVGSRGLVVQPVAVDNTAGLVSWSAAAATQLAWDDNRKPEEQRTGVFTAAYVTGIESGAADINNDATVSYQELLTYVQVKSEEYCGQNEACKKHGLTPQLEAPADALGYGVKPIAAEQKPEVLPVAYEEPQVAPAGTADQYAGKPEEAVMTYVTTEVAAPAPAYGGVTDIIGRPSDGVVSMKLVPSASMKTGDVFKIEVVSDKPGYLVLYDIDEAGTATQLFPNTQSRKGGMLRANAPFTIPDDDYGFDFKAGSPGKSTMLAIVVQDPVDIEKLAPASKGLAVVEKAATTIVSQLNEPYVDMSTPEAPQVRETKWSYALAPYVIN